jgi:hypothetical protein
VSSTVAQVLHCLHPPSAIDIRAIVWPKRECGITSFIIDDRAACRNLHRAAPTSTRSLSRSLTMLPNQRTLSHSEKSSKSTSIGFSHCRGREYERWRGYYARLYDKPGLNLAIPKRERKEDTICQPQTRSPQEEEIKKRRGPSVLLVH